MGIPVEVNNNQGGTHTHVLASSTAQASVAAVSKACLTLSYCVLLRLSFAKQTRELVAADITPELYA